MDAQSLRNDIQAAIKAKGLNLRKLAQMAGVSQSSLWSFVNCQREAISTDTLFRLWPHIYGDQTPIPLPLAEAETSAKTQAAVQSQGVDA